MYRQNEPYRKKLRSLKHHSYWAPSQTWGAPIKTAVCLSVCTLDKIREWISWFWLNTTRKNFTKLSSHNFELDQTILTTIFSINMNTFVGFQVLVAVVMKSSISCDIMSCSPLKVNGSFGGTFCLLLQRRRISQARNEREGGKQIVCQHIFYPENGGDFFLRNVCRFSTDCTTFYSRKYNTSWIFFNSSQQNLNIK
jgi:hypothetical protein